MGKRAKTDPIDAAVIARFAAATKPTIRPLADAETTALADLISRRRQIIQMPNPREDWGGGQREKRASKRMKKSIQRLCKALQTELTDIDREIDDSVRGSPLWRHNENLMVSVPGVGPVIAHTLMAELPELGTLDLREVAALAGLAPFTRQSGQLRGKAFIAAGRAPVRTAVFTGRWSQPATPRPSKPFTSVSSPPESPRWSP